MINQLEDKPLNKKLTALMGVCVAVLMLLGACAVKESEETATASASPEASATKNLVVAEVNGEPIYYDQFYTIYANACASYGISEDDETNGAYIKNMIIESLVEEKIMTQKLTENGYMNLSDEETAEATKNAQDYLDSIIDSYYGDLIKADLAEGYTDEQYEQAKEPYVDKVLAGMGYTKDEFFNYYKQMVAQDNAREALVGDIVPSEEDVKAKYDENVASDQESMDADPSGYESVISSGITAYYVPSGVRMVRQVLFKIDDASSGAVSTLRQAGYDEQADYLLEKALQDVKSEADSVLSKLKNGSLKFDEAITTYNDDTGMPEEGYPVTEGSATYVKTFTEGAMGIAAVGEFTELVPSDYGYHIIEYFRDVPAGAAAYDDVRQEIYDELLSSMQDDAWQTIIDEWTKESTVVKHEENM